MPVEVIYAAAPALNWGTLHPPLVLGRSVEGHEVTLDLDALLTGRLLIQAPSGAGKSTLLRHLVRVCAGHMQWLLIDPEGEHGKHLTNWQPGLETPRHAAVTWRELGMSRVIDISERQRDQQLMFLSEFALGLVESPRELWSKRCLVLIDECEIFTPSGLEGKRSRAALIDLMARGRKRGLATVIATHRLSQLATSVRAEARNFLIGGSSFDIDISRAATALGWSKQRAFEIIPRLQTGMFVASGPAFGKETTIVMIPKP